MKPNIEKIIKFVSNHFYNVERVDESIISAIDSYSIVRFQKKVKNKAYAVCYLDFSKDLPDTIKKLNDYQDSVVGHYYFEGQKSLQWNNYIYFVIDKACYSKKEVSKAKELIENDRIYARKFVVFYEDVDSILIPTELTVSQDIPHGSILSIWTDRLVKAGIDKAILSKENMPNRIKLIEDMSFIPNSKPKMSEPASKVEEASSIKSIKLINYLEYPLQRYFEFGKVNLIVGPNGSGKTSLLESIELFYCGKNKRNPNAPLGYEFFVELANGEKETATNKRSSSVFRDCNLEWYGQAEIKTNNIYQSFAKFNFLDTDAAMSLADSTSNYEDDISKLLVGPEAADTWKTIERVYETILAENKYIKAQLSQIAEEIQKVDLKIEIAGNKQCNSQLIHGRLKEMIHNVGWSASQDDMESFVSMLVPNLPAFIALIQQVLSFDWLEYYISFNGLTNYCNETKVVIEKVESKVSQFVHFENENIVSKKLISIDREVLYILEKAEKLIEANVPILLENQRKQQEIIVKYTGLLAGLYDIDLDKIETINCNFSLNKCYDIAISKRHKAETLLNEQKRNYAEFVEAQSKSVRLSQELRHIADKILSIDSNTDQCPLCHTQFKAGELIKHITMDIDKNLKNTDQSLFSQLMNQETTFKNATNIEFTLALLIGYHEKANLNESVALNAVLLDVKKSKQMLSKAKFEKNKTDGELNLLKEQGLESRQIEQISVQLHDFGYTLPKFNMEEVEKLRAEIESNMADLSKIIESKNKNIADLKEVIAATLNHTESEDKHPMEILSQLKERYSKVNLIRSKIIKFNNIFPITNDKPLAELLVEVISIRQTAVELQTVLSREKKADISFNSSLTIRTDLKLKQSNLKKREKKFAKVEAVLKDLKEHYSLEAAMECSLQENRANIEKIFSRIHSPAEFQGIGANWNSLLRKNGREASLSQISTGQRAALALSIFLSQNAQLKKAPPVILIDDPIAHIDDLNSLSFLDYLREVALSNKRQIFFSTSNDKLAALFERKFDFLGKDFRRFDLKRSTNSESDK